jgi:NAD(P)-dependent dehydrogenase (short-subunit alcohol dehydrogenase family)
VRDYDDCVRAVALDVTDAAAARAAVQAAVDDFRAQIETDLFGVVNVTKAAVPGLRQQRSGFCRAPWTAVLPVWSLVPCPRGGPAYSRR